MMAFGTRSAISKWHGNKARCYWLCGLVTAIPQVPVPIVKWGSPGLLNEDLTWLLALNSPLTLLVEAERMLEIKSHDCDSLQHYNCESGAVVTWLLGCCDRWNGEDCGEYHSFSTVWTLKGWTNGWFHCASCKELLFK